VTFVDLNRIDELRSVFGDDLRSMLVELRDNIKQSARQIEAGLVDGRLDEVAMAAHGARNDALMLGARHLLPALEELEQTARRGALSDAQRAAAQVQQKLPPTLRELDWMAAG
jgi:HPt (histidine-containing phosphotransfer) domain-containing protein